MNDIWIQFIVSGAAVITGMFVTIRYQISQNSKREKFFLDYLRQMQDQQLEYYESKNGHLERISKLFSKAIDKNTQAINKLAKTK